MTLPASPAILIHGGPPADRAALAAAVRVDTRLAPPHGVRVRLSSRAAEAAKCLADPAVVAVFLLGDPPDAAAVRAAAAAHDAAPTVFALEARDGADVVRALIREALVRVSDRP